MSEFVLICFFATCGVNPLYVFPSNPFQSPNPRQYYPSPGFSPVCNSVYTSFSQLLFQLMYLVTELLSITHSLSHHSLTHTLSHTQSHLLSHSPTHSLTHSLSNSLSLILSIFSLLCIYTCFTYSYPHVLIGIPSVLPNIPHVTTFIIPV
jgi:hypothetical protein